MNDNLTFGIVAFTQLLVVYNPLSAMPMFASLTMEDSRRERLRTALVGVATSVIVMVVFTFAGHAILDFFAITTEAFQIAAGVIFFGIGSDMLAARRSRVKTTRREQDEAASRDSLAIIPLGLPTLAGPGTIVTVIALAGLADGGLQLFSVYLASFMVGAAALPCLILAPALLNALGRTGLNVGTRIMGLLVMVIGVQFLINGIGIVVASWGLAG
ncbi:MAG: NAAT family transporter [Gemmatimonadota bacterium]|nr:NAAT family transporter [Gemmatimonadota bacterium]MDE2871584.1 NAAT family transporter [Gemmatimonadota bacterium]